MKILVLLDVVFLFLMSPSARRIFCSRGGMVGIGVTGNEKYNKIGNEATA